MKRIRGREAVQPPVQGRYEAVQAGGVFTKPWELRTDGKRALLVNERTTVFDRPLAPPPLVDPLEEIAAGDTLPGKMGWTADLVHCRLLNVGDTIARLPSPLRRGYVSLLGDAALADRPIKRPPTAAEISVADWTWAQLLQRPATQRSILQAMAFGASGQSVAKMLNRGSSMNVHRATVVRWYMSERKHLATAWQVDRQLVDHATAERWRGLFDRSQK